MGGHGAAKAGARASGAAGEEGTQHLPVHNEAHLVTSRQGEDNNRPCHVGARKIQEEPAKGNEKPVAEQDPGVDPHSMAIPSDNTTITVGRNNKLDYNSI